MVDTIRVRMSKYHVLFALTKRQAAINRKAKIRGAIITLMNDMTAFIEHFGKVNYFRILKSAMLKFLDLEVNSMSFVEEHQAAPQWLEKKPFQFW